MLQIKELPYLVTDGIFSHLALLDDASNLEQYQRFTSVINVLQPKAFLSVSGTSRTASPW